MTAGRTLSLDLPANHGAVALARRVVRHFAKLGGISDESVEVLALVSSELLANAVDHGGGGGAMGTIDPAAGVSADPDDADAGKTDAGNPDAGEDSGARMRLSLSLDQGGWTFRVSDEGGGDPAEVRNLIAPDGPPDLEDERGRGFFLVAQMVDRLDVEKSPDGRGLTFVAERAGARA